MWLSRERLACLACEITKKEKNSGLKYKKAKTPVQTAIQGHGGCENLLMRPELCKNFKTV